MQKISLSTLLLLSLVPSLSFANTILCNDLGLSSEPVSIEVSGMIATVDYFDLKTNFKFIKNEVSGSGISSYFKEKGGDGSFGDLIIYKGPNKISARMSSGKYKFIECSSF